jgi:membrane protease YdiL (CAAX protease family)
LPIPTQQFSALDSDKKSSDMFGFFALTYALTWAFWVPAVLAHAAARAWPATLWLLGTFSPTFVAITLTAREAGGAGVRDLLARMFRWRAHLGWYLFAISYIAVVKLVVAVLHRLILGAWPQFGTTPLLLTLAGVMISTPFQSGEEIGWRGFALPRLAAKMGYGRAALVLGIIWAAWHLPQFFLAAADTYHQPFLIWSLQVVALSVAFAWLYVRTDGSLLLTMLLHAAVNNTKDIVPSATANATNTFSLYASPVMYLTVLVLWAAAIYFLARMAPRQQVA